MPVDASTGLFFSKCDAYVQKLKAKLDEWNATIDKLQVKAEQKEAEFKIGF